MKISELLAEGAISYSSFGANQFIIDQTLSPSAIRFIEKIVNSGFVRAQIVDYQANQKWTYNPDDESHRTHPLYDEPVDGVDRAPVGSSEAKRYGWLLETGAPRRGILQPILIEGKNPPQRVS